MSLNSCDEGVNKDERRAKKGKFERNGKKILIGNFIFTHLYPLGGSEWVGDEKV